MAKEQFDIRDVVNEAKTKVAKMNRDVQATSQKANAIYALKNAIDNWKNAKLTITISNPKGNTDTIQTYIDTIPVSMKFSKAQRKKLINDILATVMDFHRQDVADQLELLREEGGKL